MPNIKSAKKRVKIIARKSALNKSQKSALKTTLKKANAALTAGDANSADAVKAAIKKIDKSVSKGLIHKNTAARRKSKLQIKLNKTM